MEKYTDEIIEAMIEDIMYEGFTFKEVEIKYNGAFSCSDITRKVKKYLEEHDKDKFEKLSGMLRKRRGNSCQIFNDEIIKLIEGQIDNIIEGKISTGEVTEIINAKISEGLLGKMDELDPFKTKLFIRKCLSSSPEKLEKYLCIYNRWEQKH